MLHQECQRSFCGDHKARRRVSNAVLPANGGISSSRDRTSDSGRSELLLSTFKEVRRVAIVLLNADVLINLLWLGVTKDDQRSVLLKVLVDSDRLIWTQVDI